MPDAGAGGVVLNEKERLVAVDKVEGTPVCNRGDERVGSVHTVMTGECSDRVAYAVPGFGAFLGVGERRRPLPWKALDHDRRLGGHAVDVTREQFERAPSYASDEAPWDAPGHGRSVYGYCGMAYPYMGV